MQPGLRGCPMCWESRYGSCFSYNVNPVFKIQFRAHCQRFCPLAGLLGISHRTIDHVVSSVFTEAGHVHEACPEDGNDSWKVSTWGRELSDL